MYEKKTDLRYWDVSPSPLHTASSSNNVRSRLFHSLAKYFDVPNKKITPYCSPFNCYIGSSVNWYGILRAFSH